MRENTVGPHREGPLKEFMVVAQAISCVFREGGECWALWAAPRTERGVHEESDVQQCAGSGTASRTRSQYGRSVCRERSSGAGGGAGGALHEATSRSAICAFLQTAECCVLTFAFSGKFTIARESPFSRRCGRRRART